MSICSFSIKSNRSRKIHTEDTHSIDVSSCSSRETQLYIKHRCLHDVINGEQMTEINCVRIHLTHIASLSLCPRGMIKVNCSPCICSLTFEYTPFRARLLDRYNVTESHSLGYRLLSSRYSSLSICEIIIGHNTISSRYSPSIPITINEFEGINLIIQTEVLVMITVLGGVTAHAGYRITCS